MPRRVRCTGFSRSPDHRSTTGRPSAASVRSQGRWKAGLWDSRVLIARRLGVGKLVGGIAVIRTPEPEQIERILDMALDGLRYKPPIPEEPS